MNNQFATAEQPAPIPGGVIVLEHVIGDMKASFAVVLAGDLRQRADIGRERYGTYLMANNGRLALVDLYQELLDAIMIFAA